MKSAAERAAMTVTTPITELQPITRIRQLSICELVAGGTLLMMPLSTLAAAAAEARWG
jgi:hypothetical protein